MHDLKSRLRKANNNRRYNKEARAALAMIPMKPTAADRALCDEYAADVLGSKGYAPWLHVYAAVAGRFLEGWMPDNYFKQYVVWPSSYAGFSARRSLSAALFPDAPIPDIAYLVDGKLITRDGRFLAPQDAAKTLFALGERVIFKLDFSAQGKGIFFFGPKDLTPERLGTLSNGVFQQIIKQHDSIAALSPDAVTTLRMTTVISHDRGAEVRGIMLRMPRTGHTHIKAGIGFHTTVDSETGRLGDIGYTAGFASRHTAHPDTGQTLAEITIPGFADFKKLVTDLHAQFPFAECIGWDLAIDHDGKPQILEWNTGHVSIRVTEAMAGPMFKDLDWHDRWRDPRY